jgi:uncharacterized protein (DUF111 family)
MKVIVIGSEEVEFNGKDKSGKETGEMVKLTKISLLKEDKRVKEVYVSEKNLKGFDPKMTVNLFEILEEADYVDVSFTEDYTGKAKLDKIVPFEKQ